MTVGLTQSPEAEAARLLASDPAVQRVILFGSRAEGKAHRGSDMDLAVDVPSLSRTGWARLCDLMDTRRSLTPVDAHLLHDLPKDWREEIERTGQVLFVRAT